MGDDFFTVYSSISLYIYSAYNYIINRDTSHTQVFGALQGLYDYAGEQTPVIWAIFLPKCDI